MWKALAFLMITATLTVIAGCACQSQGGCHSVVKPHVSGSGLWQSQPQTRESLSGGAVDLLAYKGPETGDIPSAADSWTYLPLDAAACRCQAAASSLLGNLFDSQSKALRQGGGESRCVHSQTTTLESELLAFRAVHARNESAGNAAALFYSLAEAEVNYDILNESLEISASAIRDLDDSRAAGFAVEENRAELVRMRNELISQQAELGYTICDFNSNLYRLLGGDWNASTMIWPTVDMNVDAELIEVEAAMDTAMVLRADFVALDVAGRWPSEAIAVAVSQLMGGGGGSSRTSGQPGGIMSGRGQGHGGCETIRQLEMLRSAKYREVQCEIALGAERLRAAGAQLALAREKLRAWDRTIVDLQNKQAVSAATSDQLFEARMARIGAKRELVHEIAAYRIAENELKRAQGLLAFECGYELPRSACGPHASVASDER